jgi:hypothetical protein
MALIELRNQAEHFKLYRTAETIAAHVVRTNSEAFTVPPIPPLIGGSFLPTGLHSHILLLEHV